MRRFNADEVMDKEVMLGLERQTKDGLERAQVRRVVNETVFSMQEVQQLMSFAKSNLIAKFYKRSCVKPALKPASQP